MNPAHKWQVNAIVCAIVVACVAVIAWNAVVEFPWIGSWQASAQHDGQTLALNFYFFQAGRNGPLKGHAAFKSGGETSLQHLDASFSHIDFDLPVRGREYHFHGTRAHHDVTGTWSSSDLQDIGPWNAHRGSSTIGSDAPGSPAG